MKKLKITMIVLLVLFLAGCSKNVEQQVAEQLELGQKYLAELDYEQAIVAFNKVIELDAKIEEGYLGLAKAHMGIGDQKQAADVLESGVQSIGMVGVSEDYKDLMIDAYLFLAHESEDSGDDAAAEMYYDRILKISPNQEDAMDRKRVLAARKEIAPYYEDIKKIASEIMVDDISNINESVFFTEEFESIVKDLEDPVIYQADDRNYLGIYPGGYIYWGEMNNGLREGNGLWFFVSHEDDGHKAYCKFEGKWEDDYPNGAGEFIDESLDTIGNYAARSIISGNYNMGYQDGAAVMETASQEGDTYIFDFFFHEGKPEVIADSGDTIFPYVYSYARNKYSHSYLGDGTDIWGVQGAMKK